MYTDCIWREIYYPAPEPESGVLRRSGYRLDWPLPAVHRQYVSVTGEWWTLTLPIWFLVSSMLLAAWLARDRCREATATDKGDVGSGRYDRFTRWIRWTSAVVAALVFVIWISSGIWSVTFSDARTFHIDIWAGVISFATLPEPTASYWEGTPAAAITYSGEPFRMNWTLPHTADCAQSTIGAWWELNIPIWIVFGAVCIPLLPAIRRCFGRGFGPGACAKCAYNLTGNSSGVCPECGVRVVRDSSA